MKWPSKLGDDPFSRFIHKPVRGEGVDFSSCLFTDKVATGLICKEQLSPEDVNVYYYRKDSAACLMEADELDEAYIVQAKVLYIIEITPALSKSCYQISVIHH